MPPPTRLSLPGLLALIALALMLMYIERGRDAGPSRPEAGSSSGASSSSGSEPRPTAAQYPTGDFAYYALVMSWSPTHCATPEGQDDDTQCARRDGRRYAFILHGLWPQYDRGYPESCPTPERPFVPQSVIDRVIDVMPSKGLIIHEYRKHGTCSGLSPEAYFQMARRAFVGVKVPERFRNPSEDQFLSPRDLIQEFVAANPGLESSMMAVECGGSKSRLREIRICVSKSGDFRRCGPNENQGRLCRSDRMHVPPVRGGS